MTYWQNEEYQKTSNMANTLKIDAEKGKQELFIIREFEYPREKVFKAFSNPDILVQFFGPDRLRMRFDYADFRTGGSYRYIHETKEGQQVAAFNGTIHEMTAPERIIQTSEFEGIPERGHVVLEAILFESLPGNRTKVTFHDVCRSVTDRDMIVRSGMEKGLSEGFNRLDLLLQKGKSSRTV
jgi:uncharacterized protein YndB with AHSA1/START domain